MSEHRDADATHANPDGLPMTPAAIDATLRARGIALRADRLVSLAEGMPHLDAMRRALRHTDPSCLSDTQTESDE